MTFVFWQNILSIHQSSFLSYLSQYHKIILVVEKEIDECRKQSGWNIPDFGLAEIVISPDKNNLQLLLNKKDAIHIFSGINAYSLVKIGYKLAIEKKLKIGVMTEPFNWLGIKGKLRFLKYYFYRIRYNHNISFILAIGNRGRWCFEKVGFPSEKIFDWGYFIQNNFELSLTKRKNSKEKNIIFIGSIDKNKNILKLVNICIKNKNKLNTFTIVGKGDLSAQMKEIIKNYSFINYYEVVQNKDICNYISNSDLLVLPSVYDGWGVVINESLMCGTPVIVSDHCGASVLIKGIRGKIFSVENNDLEPVFLSFLEEIPYKLEQRIKIQEWANRNISGKSAAGYFLEIMESVFADREKPQAPWLKNM